MCSVCPGFRPVLAPCLLVGRMLGPGWLVHFRRIGLDHPIGVPSDAVTERDNRRWRLAAGLASWSSFLVAMESGAACGRTSAPPEPAVLAGSRVAARGGSRSGGILDLGGQRLRPPRSIVGTRGVHFRHGQPVRGLAGVQWDTARSGLDGRRNPGRTVRRQTGLRATAASPRAAVRRIGLVPSKIVKILDLRQFPQVNGLLARGISTDPARAVRGE